jgi:hypothetical protein
MHRSGFNMFGSSVQRASSGLQTSSVTHESGLPATQERNRTISRMLQLYRSRRREAQGARDDISDQIPPRTLTQNFINGTASTGLRSESQRRNFEHFHMEQIISQLRSERRDENTDEISNTSGNFDVTASIVRSNERPRNLVRRPITRAAGYDSRQHNFEIPEPSRRNIHRPRNVQNIFQQQIPTYDDNFLSRSETQIQSQFHRRSQGLAPRLINNHYQSIQNLPTYNPQ